MYKGRIKINVDNVNINKIEQEEIEGLYEETDDTVILFPITRTKENQRDYYSTMILICEASNNSDVLKYIDEEVKIYYKLYCKLHKLEIALEYSRNKYEQIKPIEFKELDSNELDFINNYFISQADFRISELAKKDY